MYYFASDMHLGSPLGYAPSIERERRLVGWLDAAGRDAKAIYLVGDVFDFWFEYRMVVPKGFTRFLGKLAELTDAGVEVHLLMGNHDMWMCGYLEQECGVVIHRKKIDVQLYGKRVYMAHGDMVTDREKLSSRIRGGCLRSSTLRWLFSRFIHPTLALRFGHWWSGRSRVSHYGQDAVIDDNNPLIRFARQVLLKEGRVDKFIFGHLHKAAKYDLGGGSEAVFVGDWLDSADYAVMTPDGEIKLYNLP